MNPTSLDARSLRGVALQPPISKSDALRALALSQVQGGPAVALPASDLLPRDVLVMQRGLRVLGAGEGQPIDCRDGGAPFRLLLALASVQPGTWTFTGTERLAQRPHDELLDALGAALAPHGLQATAPVRWPFVVRGAKVQGDVAFAVDASRSSQHVSAVLLAAAHVARQRGCEVRVTLRGPLASAGYLDLSLRWLQRMGFSATRCGDGITVGPGVPPAAAPPIPADWSAAGYLLLLAWTTGGSVVGLDRDEAHPDRAILTLLEDLGLRLGHGPGDRIEIAGKAKGGLVADARRCPDLMPTLAALACTLHGPTRIDGTAILRDKESDRVHGIQTLVEAAGGKARLDGDTLHIAPGAPPQRIEVRTFGDHRLAMAGATLACLLRAQAQLDDAGCVAKSFPGFFAELGRLGVRIG